ncbi:MAG: zinc-dependent peptidase [Firmicutes bacterium]|nr:zinc-dependent peptidase [Bacillota bacterium]
MRIPVASGKKSYQVDPKLQSRILEKARETGAKPKPKIAEPTAQEQSRNVANVRLYNIAQKTLQTSGHLETKEADQPEKPKTGANSKYISIIDKIKDGISSFVKSIAAGIKKIFNVSNPDDPTGSKSKIVDSMIVNKAGVKDTSRINDILVKYPQEQLQHSKDYGTKIYVLKDNPGPNDLKPSDLGFGSKTGDGRDWNNVTGGYNDSSKVMYLKESMLSRTDDYARGTILHEFSHSIDHSYRNDPKYAAQWSAKVDGLYQAAKSNQPGHKFVDGYAATDKYEFFAQSNEAYYTDVKVPQDPSNDNDTYYSIDNLNRDNLQNKDNATYNFLNSLNTNGVDKTLEIQ